MTPPVTSTIRDMGDAISPSWLNGPNGKRYRYCMAVVWDALLDTTAYAVRAGCPSTAPSDAFFWFQPDRGINRGPNEPLDSYIVRLQQWLDIWRHAGSPTGMLLAMRGYCAPAMPEVRTVSVDGNGTVKWSTYADGLVVFPQGAQDPVPPTTVYAGANWQWDGSSAPFYYPWMHWRIWAIVYSLAADNLWPVPTATAGGGARAGDGTCCGWGGTNDQARGLTAAVVDAKAAHVFVEHVIVCYDATAGWFDPAQPTPGTFQPDGKWGRSGRVYTDATYGQVYKSARQSGISYLKGSTIIRDHFA